MFQFPFNNEAVRTTFEHSQYSSLKNKFLLENKASCPTADYQLSIYSSMYTTYTIPGGKKTSKVLLYPYTMYERTYLVHVGCF